MARKTDPPVVLVKWYDLTKWLLERIDSFPKNQRFIFGQRLADHSLDILELLIDVFAQDQRVVGKLRVLASHA